MFLQLKPKGRIFISYRRADARGVAGRLADSLEIYFGENRIFRDIEDIKGGADFGDVIESNLKKADAVIVLMGPEWLHIKGKDGKRRIEDPHDWVAKEIAVAMELKKPVFPVLIEDTPMPRTEELPETLAPMTRFNAISISDRRWKQDVLRLGKILSFDIPSFNERKLDLARMIIGVILPLSIVTGLGFLTYNALYKEEGDLLELWQSGLPSIAILATCFILFSIIHLVDQSRKKYIYYSIYTGAIGVFLFFCLLLVFDTRFEESMITFFGGVLTGTIMYSLMLMSGFKAK